MYAFFSIIETSFRLQNKMQKAPGLHYRSQELFSSLSYQILFPGRLNCSLGGWQNYRAFARTHIWYSATISGIVTIHSRVVTTLIALA